MSDGHARFANSVNDRNQNISTQSGVRRRRQSRHTMSTVGRGVEPLELIFHNLTFTVSLKPKKGQNERMSLQILNNVTGAFRPGRIAAVMGPSGAGKTTLLDAVAGNVMGGSISGEILVNGEDFARKRIKSISGFVFQDDVLLETMTVKEAIQMSARLRLPSSVSSLERRRRVDDMLQLLHLEHCQDTYIGSPGKKGISGGERKRVATSMELIANPPMLFLDEPTSGLDTFTAFTVIQSLANLAHEHGRTIVATIHQPSSDIFHLFDDLVLMQAGRIVYCGPASAALGYFSRIGYSCPQYSNPADFFFMQVLDKSIRAVPISKDPENQQEIPINYLADEWDKSEERNTLMRLIDDCEIVGVGVGSLRKKAPVGIQFSFLTKRAFRNVVRNPLMLKLNVVTAIFLGVLSGLVFLNSTSYAPPVQIRNISGALYFLTLSQFFKNVFNVLNVFHVEKQVLFREYKARYYGTLAYFFSKMIVEWPVAFIFPYLTVIIAYYMIGLTPAFSSYLMIATFAALTGLSGVGLGLLISSIFDSFRVILVVTPLILLPLFLFSGIFVSSGNLPVYFNWIKYVSPMYYCYTGMLEVQFSGTLPNCNPDEFECDGDKILAVLGVDTTFSIGVNVVFIVTLWMAYTFLAFLSLDFVTRRQYKSG